MEQPVTLQHAMDIEREVQAARTLLPFVRFLEGQVLDIVKVEVAETKQTEAAPEVAKIEPAEVDQPTEEVVYTEVAMPLEVKVTPEPKPKQADSKPKQPKPAKPPVRPRQSRGEGPVSSAMDDDLVKMYLRDIGQHSLLTKEDEFGLAEIIENGAEAKKRWIQEDGSLAPNTPRADRVLIRQGDRAFDTFVNANLRLVVSIAKKYLYSGMELLDLIQEGNLGLYPAVKKFDRHKGFKFSTYATWWIKQAITRGIANTGSAIRVPVHAGVDISKLTRTEAAISKDGDGDISKEDLAERLGWPLDKLNQVERDRQMIRTSSLDKPVGEDSDTEFGDLIADVEAVDPGQAAADSDRPEIIKRALGSLTEREAEILMLRFALDGGELQTLEQVGLQFDLTRERIRQIESRALAKLCHPSNGHVLQYLISGEV